MFPKTFLKSIRISKNKNVHEKIGNKIDIYRTYFYYLFLSSHSVDFKSQYAVKCTNWILNRLGDVDVVNLDGFHEKYLCENFTTETLQHTKCTTLIQFSLVWCVVSFKAKILLGYLLDIQFIDYGSDLLHIVLRKCFSLL